ncbi:glycosyltransferase family protein [Phaeodactylibacter luteus]|uniref:Glycosyltransferase family 4 protein n=1 Tax=Phaeodactylibacter luteus TaxID=1564516 RepID=A0A5C6RQ72_9BACT|nr:glycosyltransferase family 4 protein [Phaeodactylibacter luteus]TXB63810.1 glycosyltransferase family 4 protein [Phaeodactylibacter luteus]
MARQILYLLSGNLSTTPRALKSILYLREYYQVKIVLINRAERWRQKDQALIAQYQLEVVSVNLGRKPFWPWLLASLKQQAALRLSPFFRRNRLINAYASNKAAILLWQKIKKLDGPADLILAHSGGSFYPAWRLSNYLKVPFLFDVEDYHPGESIRRHPATEKQRREFLMQAILPAAFGLSSASPLIAVHTLKLIGGHPNHRMILNSFPAAEFTQPLSGTTTGPVKLGWFSQTIGPGRGLEQVFAAAKDHPAMQFHLIGNPKPDYLERFQLPSNIHLHPIMSQAALHAFLSTMDIGLALEAKNADLNRDLCLTNKFLAYAQAGLYVLATDTQGQRQFLESLDYRAGEIMDAGLSEALKHIDSAQLSLSHKVERWEKAKAFAWEAEQKKLLALLP